jgi:ubiquitin conjugation factor E4 B
MQIVYGLINYFMKLTDNDYNQIRAKRIAKLQAASSSSASPPSPSPASPVVPHIQQSKPKLPSAPPPRPSSPAATPNVTLKKRSFAPPPRFDYHIWENDTISTVLKVTLSV